MDLLKRQNWWIWLLLWLFTQGIGTLALGALLHVYETDTWYTKWYYWVIGALCCLFPFVIMFSIFIIQITCSAAAKLNVPGMEIYHTPYTWILCIIVPFIGWILLAVMVLYLNIEIIVRLSQGEAEQYIK